MAKYLTINQYKRYGDGVSLADVTDPMLALIITRAESGIDAHMGFDTKRGGFEPHQITMQQGFNERTRKAYIPDYPIPVRQVTRYRIQVSNLSTAGAGFFANINPGDCVINNDGNYIEIVPLTSITWALTPAIVELGLKPPIIQLDAEVGFFIANFGEHITDSGDHKTYYALSGFWATTYTQSLATQPNQLPPVPPVVYVNGNIASTSSYTYDPLEGSITFTAAQSPTSIVTLDYTQTIPDYVTEAAVIQTSHLIGQRNLNKLGMYNGLFSMRSGEQEIQYPRSINIADVGRSAQSPLCDRAAAILGRYEMVGIA